MLLFGLFCQLISSILLFCASLRDPGIIPATFVGDESAQALVDLKYQKIKRKADRIFYLNVLDKPTPIVHRMKFCETCTIFRPKDAAHCNLCGNCVQGFDHHCVWLGTCVGKRNYREFLLFVASIIIESLYVMILSCMLLDYNRKYQEGKVLSRIFDGPGLAAVALFIYCFIVSLPVDNVLVTL